MLQIRPLSVDLSKKAQEELNENENPIEIEHHVNKLRKWILQQPYLKARTDDQFLVSFLRGTKYDQKLARKKIDLFFTMRTILPEITKMRDIRFGSNANLLKLGTTIPLPMTYGKDGPRIFLLRPGRYNPKEFNIVDIFKIYILFTDFLLMNDDNFVVSGQVGILDLDHVTPEHFSQFEPEFVRKMTYFCQDAYPIRPKGFHYINTPNGFEFVFNMFKSFMSDEHKKLLYVHGYDLESLYHHIPKHLLPSEYGGEAGNIQSLNDYWEKILLNGHDDLVEWDKYGTNELLRPIPITEDTIMSMPDSSIFSLP